MSGAWFKKAETGACLVDFLAGVQQAEIPIERRGVCAPWSGDNSFAALVRTFDSDEDLLADKGGRLGRGSEVQLLKFCAQVVDLLEKLLSSGGAHVAEMGRRRGQGLTGWQWLPSAKWNECLEVGKEKACSGTGH